MQVVQHPAPVEISPPQRDALAALGWEHIPDLTVVARDEASGALLVRAYSRLWHLNPSGRTRPLPGA